MSSSTWLQLQSETYSSKLHPIKISDIKRRGRPLKVMDAARLLSWGEQVFSKKLPGAQDHHILSFPCNWESVCCPGNKYGKPNPIAHQTWRGCKVRLERASRERKFEFHTHRPMFPHPCHHIRIFFFFLMLTTFKLYEAGIIINPTL